MKYRLSKKVLLGIATLVVTSIAVLFWVNRSYAINWVEVGIGGPENWSDFPYRLINMKDLPRTHPDMTSLTLALQSRRDRGAWVYIPVSSCYAPQVLDGVPSVLCDSLNRADVYVGGSDNVREVLLSLQSESKVAAIKGKAIGLHADTPVIWVNDPALKRKAE